LRFSIQNKGESNREFENLSKSELKGKKSGANMCRNETATDMGGLAAARVVLLWS
jgi:hypothetical protein